MSSSAYIRWKEDVISHLIDYKVNKLHITDSGKHNNKIERPQILPKGSEQANYFFEDLASMKMMPGDVHHMAHYLNSSQTMCLNFFYGLINYDYLARFLSDYIPCLEIEIWEPEYIEVARNEKTNFDFWLRTTDDIEVFFEIKYTEDGFAKESKASWDNWTETYIPLCASSLNLKDVRKEEFLKHRFQIYRNIVRARAADEKQKKSYVVFLTMKKNPSTYEDLKYVESKNYQQVLVLYWEDVVSRLLNIKDIPNGLRTYLKEFADKYLAYVCTNA